MPRCYLAEKNYKFDRQRLLSELLHAYKYIHNGMRDIVYKNADNPGKLLCIWASTQDNALYFLISGYVDTSEAQNLLYTAVCDIESAISSMPVETFLCRYAVYSETLELLPGVDINYIAYHRGNGVTRSNYGVGASLFRVHKALSSLPIFPDTKASVRDSLLLGDQKRANLPPMEESFLIDAAKGHWDLYWPEGIDADPTCYREGEADNTWLGRDPRRDVKRDCAVAIDFGTTSTVVAVREENRHISLVPIGLTDLRQKLEARHYENPTVLEFLHYDNFMAGWRGAPFRPDIAWSDVRCAHQAKAELNAGKAGPNKARCGFSNIKSWARGKVSATSVPVGDEEGASFVVTLPPADLSPHVYGDFSRDTVNPIELYAFFLGMYLNNQLAQGGRIFTQYYMTFPVKFDRESRDRILNGFRRGLARSLPPSLAYNPDWRLENEFSIEEIANEPTAYAAVALTRPQMLDTEALPPGEQHPEEARLLEPTTEGLPFGIFDFGGGTTDFSVGLYRLARLNEQDEEGWERVIDILDSAGDPELGGEHLLHNLALEVIKRNVDALRRDVDNPAIPFMLREEEMFHGAELLMDTTAIAQGNMVKLQEALRPLWEKDAARETGDGEEADAVDGTEGTLVLSLWDRQGNAVDNVTLNTPREELRGLLRERIRRGVQDFFATFRQGFKEHNVSARTLHILLAGNSCRSPLVSEVFHEEIKKIQGNDDVIYLYKPLLPDDKHVDAPNLKTGVAIGLLHMAPGERTGLVERNAPDGEAPFRYCVGRFAGGKLVAVLQRNVPYGQWKVLGKVFKHGREVLGYTLSPQAIEESIREDDCLQKTHKWGAENAGRVVCIRAHTPDSIQLALRRVDNDGEDVQVDEQSCITMQLKG